MTTFDDLVYGERLDDLSPVRRRLTKESHLDDSGMCQFYGEFEAEVEQRTSDERSADALARVAGAMSALL